MNELELNYQLAELPSAQHRAGLAGLVLMVRYLHRFEQRKDAIINFTNLDEFSTTLKLNLEGLKALFDLTYKAFTEERATDTKINKFDRVEEVETKDAKGKTKLINRYYYSVTVPYGAFLPDWDKSSDDPDNGLWVKLWRDMLWQIIRGVPTTRNPFNYRVNGSYSKDAEKVWDELKNPEKSTGQSGNYYLGAMASNPENVPTKDTVRYQFLLHFWAFAAQVYRPATFDKDGRRDLKSNVGYVLAIPDVANLIDFCDEFPNVLEERESVKSGYLPREAIIDLPEEGALDLLRLLRDRIARKTGSQTIIDLILGVELIHAEKVGKSGVKIRSISQVEPVDTQVDKYTQINKAYWCPWFRKQRLLNLLRDKPWWYDFDALLSRIPRKWFEDSYFSHDARELLHSEGEINVKSDIRSNAQIIYQICQHYVLSKLESKYQMAWDKSKKYIAQSGKPISQKDFDEKKYKIANEAFLAVRSRTESKAFVDYFVSTLYPFIRKDEFVDFADALFNKSDEIRALTLLALSSQFPSKKKSESENSEAEAA